MTTMISIGSVKTSGTSTLALTLASVAAAAGIPVLLIDASRDGDLAQWARKPGRPRILSVEEAKDEVSVERLMRGARRRGDIAILDCGDDASIIRCGARLADRALVPVRFSPLSVCAGIVTDRFLAEEAGLGAPGRDRFFVATEITMIASRIARAIEAMLGESQTRRLEVGLAQRAAYEAPFLHGGTIFTLDDTQAPGLDRARAEAAILAYEAGLLGRAPSLRHTPAFERAA